MQSAPEHRSRTRLPPIATTYLAEKREAPASHLIRETRRRVNKRKKTFPESLSVTKCPPIVKEKTPTGTPSLLPETPLKLQTKGTQWQSSTPLTKFKTMARMVKNHIMLTKGLMHNAEEHLKTYVDDEQAGTLTFNVNAFRPETQSCGGLTPRAKGVLMKPSWLRTHEELKFLHTFTLKLKCFERYPVYVRKELSSVLYYESFEKGRVIIRQGDIGFNFYFILSGGVLVELQEEDQQTGKKHNMVVGELGIGSAFGELALLHDARRRATILCKEDSEFLRIDKPDFDMVLKKNHERELNARMQHFQENPVFANWTKTNLTVAVEGSQLVEYPPNTVILKDLTATSDKIYIITHGTCKVVQKIYLWEQLDSNNEKLVLPVVHGEHNQEGSNLEAAKKGMKKVTPFIELALYVPMPY